MAKRWQNRPAGSNWGEFGEDDQRGRLNLLTAERRLRALPVRWRIMSIAVLTG